MVIAEKKTHKQFPKMETNGNYIIVKMSAVTDCQRSLITKFKKATKNLNGNDTSFENALALQTSLFQHYQHELITRRVTSIS